MSVSRRALVRYLEESGFRLLREGAKHSMYTNGEIVIAVKRHRLLDRITANQICKQAEIEPKFWVFALPSRELSEDSGWPR
jgi:predicted RNA binding protein YcfA (HicA-like mRNA interferase family)